MNCSRWMLVLALLVGTLGPFALAYAEVVVDFEDVPLPSSTSAGDYYNGSDLAGGFVSRAISFNNDYNAAWSSWSGWAASNSTDTTTAGFANQYSAFPGSGAQGSDNFGMAHNFAPGVAVITFPLPTEVTGTYITNGTYAALSMRDGDQFAKKFGGASGNEPDWFKLAIFGKDMSGGTTGTVDFYLADYRFGDNNQDYIVNEWTWVDLTSLGTEVKSLEFELTSSDRGDFGMNTPAYVAWDNLELAVSAMPGDFNLDTIVDGVDRAIWQQNFGTLPSGGAHFTNGDADEDGDVDGSDFLAWQRHFSASLPLVNLTAGSRIREIPEPTGLALAAIAGLLLAATRHKNRTALS